MRLLFTILGAACAAPAPTGLVLHGASIHVGEECGEDDLGAPLDCDELNGANPGLALEWASEQPWRIEAGFFENSFRDLSAYAGGTWEAVRWRAVELGLAGALAHYPDGTDTAVVPLAGPFLRVNLGRLSGRVVYAPVAKEGEDGLVMFSLGWGLE